MGPKNALFRCMRTTLLLSAYLDSEEPARNPVRRLSVRVTGPHRVGTQVFLEGIIETGATLYAMTHIVPDRLPTSDRHIRDDRFRNHACRRSAHSEIRDHVQRQLIGVT